MAKVLINHRSHEFYCWRWSRWFGFKKFFYCYQTSCQRMVTPHSLTWKVGNLGGVLVQAGAAD